MENLTFAVENLGAIRSGEFTQKPLTIFCGPNNSGKTWAMYSLYYHHYTMTTSRQGIVGLLEQKPASRQEGIAGLLEQELTLADYNRKISAKLADMFNTSLALLANAGFRLAGLNETEFRQYLARTKTAPFLMPAERNGLHLFFRELSTRRTALLHYASKEDIDLGQLLRDVIHSRYAMPIAHYIDWLNQLPEIQRGPSGAFHEQALELQKQLAGGAYRVERSTGNIRFKPHQRTRAGAPTQSMGLHVASSTVKSLFGLWFYLENQAQPGDLLMIDEPELNIHPENQRKVARLLARLVNAGLNIVISTHSDYIVREFNNLLMLSQDDGALRKKHKYAEDEILKVEQVSACLFDNRTIAAFELTPEDGIYASTFDHVIEDLNQVNDDIYYSLLESRLEPGDD